MNGIRLLQSPARDAWVATTSTTQLALGHTRDVVLVDATLERSVRVADEMPRRTLVRDGKRLETAQTH